MSNKPKRMKSTGYSRKGTHGSLSKAGKITQFTEGHKRDFSAQKNEGRISKSRRGKGRATRGNRPLRKTPHRSPLQANRRKYYLRVILERTGNSRRNRKT